MNEFPEAGTKIKGVYAEQVAVPVERASMRGLVGEMQIQSDRYAGMTLRILEILEAMGVRNRPETKGQGTGTDPMPSDMRTVLEITNNTIRAANNQLEDCLAQMEQELI